MEFLSIFAVLAQRRRIVGVGAVVSVLGALLLAGVLGVGPGSSTAATSVLAASRVQLDFPTAIAVDLVSVHETISTQAALMADLVAGEEQRVAIARRAAVRPSDIGTVRLQLSQLLALGQLPERAAEVASLPRGKRYSVDVQAAPNLPIIAINVAAPTVAEARRLNSATIEQLRAVAAARAPSRKRALQVIRLDPVQAAAVRPADPWTLYGILGGAGFFLLWCCALVVLGGMLRVWRTTIAAAVAHAAR